MFTGQSKDVDIETLLYLDDETINKVLMVNKYTRNLCNNQYFWLRLIQVRFPYLNQDVLSKYRGDMNWSEYYNELKSVNTSNKYINYILLDNSELGRLDKVMITVHRGADVRYLTDLSVIVAIKGGYLDVVKYLKDAGADVTSNEDQALLGACYNGHLDIVKYLVSQGANVMSQDEGTIIRASQGGHLDVVKYLVEQLGDGQFSKDTLKCALFIAKDQGRKDLVEYIVSLKHTN
jgi:ankyrin repeat protein